MTKTNRIADLLEGFVRCHLCHRRLDVSCNGESLIEMKCKEHEQEPLILISHEEWNRWLTYCISNTSLTEPADDYEEAIRYLPTLQKELDETYALLGDYRTDVDRLFEKNLILKRRIHECKATISLHPYRLKDLTTNWATATTKKRRAHLDAVVQKFTVYEHGVAVTFKGHALPARDVRGTALLHKVVFYPLIKGGRLVPARRKSTFQKYQEYRVDGTPEVAGPNWGQHEELHPKVFVEER